jgi:hypothetical protein
MREHSLTDTGIVDSVAEEHPIFRDIERAVEEASDTVCNTGLWVTVENDDSEDAEERRITRFILEGCKCQLNSGSPCSSLLSAADLLAARDECRQLTREQMDMVVMGQLCALCHRDPQTQKSKTRNTDRKRTTTLFRYGGYRVCQKVFLFLHSLSNTRFEAIKRS